MTYFTRLRAAIALAALMFACTSPTNPTSPSNPPPTGGLALGTVSGVAYEHTAAGIRPLAGLPLLVKGYTDRNTFVTIDVVTDAAGAYQVQGLWREYVLVSARPQEAYLSPCSVRLWLWNDDSKDIHVVSRTHLLAAGPTRSMPPLSSAEGYPSVDVLSGFVTERTPSGVRPVVEASVEHLYGDGQSGDPTGFTVTNADGYYVLCGYVDDYGQAVRVRKEGYHTAIQKMEWRVDVELVRD